MTQTFLSGRRWRKVRVEYCLLLKVVVVALPARLPPRVTCNLPTSCNLPRDALLNITLCVSVQVLPRRTFRPSQSIPQTTIAKQVHLHIGIPTLCSILWASRQFTRFPSNSHHGLPSTRPLHSNELSIDTDSLALVFGTHQSHFLRPLCEYGGSEFSKRFANRTVG